MCMKETESTVVVSKRKLWSGWLPWGVIPIFNIFTPTTEKIEREGIFRYFMRSVHS